MMVSLLGYLAELFLIIAGCLAALAIRDLLGRVK